MNGILTKKACIFDLDGTLVDSYADIGDAVNLILQEFGFEKHPLDNYLDWIGNGLTNLIRLSLPEDNAFDETQFKEFVSAVAAEYKKNCTHKTYIYDGIPKVLDCLRKNSVKICVLSNKPDALTQYIVEHYFGKWKFDFVMGYQELFPKKPAVESTYHILNQIKVKPEDCIFIGDSIFDLETARNAKMDAIVCLWGYGKENIHGHTDVHYATKPIDILNNPQKE